MKNQKRQTQLSWLVGLSALSAVALYIIQGALATGADVKTFPAWFWIADYVLWGFRALIEARVIVYLFSTDAQNKRQEFVLAVFEVALIALIALTVGPALRAAALGKQMVDTVAPWMFTAWSFGIASYTPLMVGAAGYAYRVQKLDNNDDAIAELEEQLRTARADAQEAHSEMLHNADEFVRRGDELMQIKATHEQQLAAAVKASALLESFSKAEQAQLYLLVQNGDGKNKTVAEIAERLRMSETSVRNARNELVNESQKQKGVQGEN